MPPAQFNLGNAYAKGQGVAQDYVEVQNWLILADANGYADAKKNSAILERGMKPGQIAEARRRATEWKPK